MISLLRTEFSRLRHRRAIAGLLLAAVLVPVALWASAAWEHRPVSAEDRAQALAEQLAPIQESVSECISHPADWDVRGTKDQIDAKCREMVGDPGGIALDQVWVRDELDLRQLTESNGLATGLVTLLAGVLFVIGATFAGADWATGSMSNQLLVEPRRGRVWGAKALVVGLVGAVVAVVVSAVFWVAMVVLARVWDRPPVPGIAETLIWLNLRGVLLVALTGVAGFAVGMLLRSTGGAIAVIFVVSVGAELLLRALPIGDPERWTPSTNVVAWIDNGTQYWSSECLAMGCEQGLLLPLSQATVYLTLLFLVVCAASWRSFARRDVP